MKMFLGEKMVVLYHAIWKLKRHFCFLPGFRLFSSQIPFPSSNTPQTPHNFQLHSILNLLPSCKDLKTLLKIHGQLIIQGHYFNNSSRTHLINLYSSFQRCEISRLIFDSTPNPGGILWNSMIRAYTRVNKHAEAIQLYHLMQEKSVEPDKYTYTFVLKACTGSLDLEEGLVIYRQIVDKKLEHDVFIGTGLLDMFCKLGELSRARITFDKMPVKDVVALNAMISGLAQSAEPNEALEFFKNMHFGYCIKPNAVSFLNLFPAVCKLGDVHSCTCIHGYIWRRDFPTAVLNGLIDMYAKCGCAGMARVVFDQMNRRDDVTLATMMSGYAYNGMYYEVLELFDCMKKKIPMMNKVSCVSALSAASELRDLKTGLEIHDCAVKLRIDSDIMVSTSLITMYVKCGELEKAGELFRGIQGRDLVAWSALVAALAQSGYSKEALLAFGQMQKEDLKPNVVSLVSVIPACAELLFAKLGKSLHCYAIKGDLESDISVGTSFVSMYAKCCDFTSAANIFNRMPFKEVITWNSLINGYAQIADPYHAMDMFCRFRMSGLHPDSGTMVGVLPACALLGDLDQGTQVHAQVVKYGFESDSHVNNALVDMYAKCGSLTSAELLFNQREFARDEVSWNTIISGYMHNSRAQEAMSSFHNMLSDELRPNLATFVSILPAASYLTALKEGMILHAFIARMGYLCHMPVSNSLIDMYAKCGHLEYSQQIFNEMNVKDTVSWNAMLGAYSMYGHAHEALSIFSRMHESNVKVDSVSFTSILSACRHAGLVKEGREAFDSMKQYNIKPELKHYACMVDLLGRAGLFDEIVKFIDKMPIQPDAGVWGALLDACRMHSNLILGEVAVKHLTNLERENRAHYIALSTIYSLSDRWDDATIARSRMNKSRSHKLPGCSWVTAD